MATRLQRPPDAQAAACPCRHGDVPAELAAQRPLLERAAAGDREAFARLYDGQVEGVYRYLLGWTGDRSEAAELTREVFHGALAWLPVTVGGEGEAGAWLIAMARDAVAQHRGSGWIAGPAGSGVEAAAPGSPASGREGPREVVGALAMLGDPEREVVVLRLLLGHSLAHTAHLSGYSRRAVLELQLAACLAIWRLTGGAAGGAAAPGQVPSAEEFERRLGRFEVDLTGGAPGLADALAVAGSLRRAVPGYVVAPDDGFVGQLRRELLAEAPGRAAARVGFSRRPWVATSVAVCGIVGVLALQAFGDPAPPSTCGSRPCPPPTTVSAAAAGGGGGLGTPLTTVREPSTTGSSVPGLVPRSTAPPAAPTTTRPATTRPATTRPPRPTTTRAPTTTIPTATTTPTTTTEPPAST